MLFKWHCEREMNRYYCFLQQDCCLAFILKWAAILSNEQLLVLFDQLLSWFVKRIRFLCNIIKEESIYLFPFPPGIGRHATNIADFFIILVLTRLGLK